jgi:ectoine hydroxylase-related dioxygenase (phytanoyl-CoA dioxygenase family)
VGEQLVHGGQGRHGGSVARTVGFVTTIASFEDATPLLADADALRARFVADGFLYFADLVDAAAVLGVRRDILDVVASHGWLAEGTPVENAVAGPVRHHEGSEGFWPAYVDIQRLESFHRLAFDPSLLDALRALFDVKSVDDLLVHPQKIARLSFPSTRFFTAPHQDYRYIQGTPDFVTTWMPLGDYPPDHGGLRVLSRSHGDGLLPVHEALGAGGLAVDADDDDPRWRTTTFAPGDAVVFGCLTVHGAIPNRSPSLRLSVDYRYQRVTDAIAPPSLGPHYGILDLMTDWDQLSAGWSSRRWVDAPDGLELSRFRRPNRDDLEVPASRWWRGQAGAAFGSS